MIKSGEIAEKAIKAMYIADNNIVFKSQKIDFRDRLRQNPLEGSQILYELYLTENDEDSLEKLAKFFGRKYDTISYLFFLKDPDNYLPCKPVIFKESFQRLGMETSFFAKCTYDNYTKYNEALKELALVYSSYAGHISTLDAHSFAWIIGSYKEAISYIFEGDYTPSPQELKKEGYSKTKSRLNQSEFRNNVIEYWGGKCSVTGCSKTELLIASHIKPWRDCITNSESISPYNGLLLIPNLGSLFDGGFISFADNGKIIISKDLSNQDLELLGVSADMKLSKIEEGHKEFLEYHRKRIFRDNVLKNNN